MSAVTLFSLQGISQWNIVKKSIKKFLLHITVEMFILVLKKLFIFVTIEMAIQFSIKSDLKNRQFW